MKNYVVTANPNCNIQKCHPETCNCDSYAIVYKNGDKYEVYITGNNWTVLQEICSSLNHKEKYKR